MSNAALNTDLQTSVRVPAFNSFAHTARSGVTGSHDDSMFNVVRNCHAVAARCSIPTSNAQRLPFLYILVDTCLLPLDFKEQAKGQQDWIRVAKDDRGRKKAGAG